MAQKKVRPGDNGADHTDEMTCPQHNAVARYIESRVAEFPPLTPEQLDRLRALGWGPR